MLRVKRTTIILYLLPTIITIGLLSIFPILYTTYISFTNKSVYHLNDYHFVGIQNYKEAVGSIHSDFFYVLLLTFLYVFACIAVFLIIGLATALALNNPKVRWLPFWRLVLIIPWTLPSVITALIWAFLFNYDFGTFNQLLRLVAGPKAGVPWTLNPTMTFIAVVLVNLWMSYPFFTVVILGALQSIPQELHEAASVDGATAWQRFRHITLPLLRPAVAPATILSAIQTFQMFNTVWLITQGGPITSADKPGFTSFVMVYIYNNILGGTAGNTRYGALAAISILVFIILLVMAWLSLRVSNLTKEAQI